MDRWCWLNGSVSEEILAKQRGVRLYDGDERTSFDDGLLELTSQRLIWIDEKNCRLMMNLEMILQVQHLPGGIGKSPKLSLHLTKRDPRSSPGPVSQSRSNYIRMSFKNGGESDFHQKLMASIQAMQCEASNKVAVGGRAMAQGVSKRSGIVGIERKMEEKRKEQEKDISVAFQDLSKLIEKAKEMVKLSQAISSKIKDKNGEISEDETVKFKSYLLSLGIANPVTKETHGSGTHYHMQLAREICDSLLPVLQNCDGIILLSDAYCMINRARGFELLSPDDLINACRMLEVMKLPIRLKTYDSGVSVIQLETHSEEKSVTQTVALVSDSGALTAQQLSNLLEISVFLAKERLLLAEKLGKLCRDDSVEGLRFYLNKFMTLP